MSSNEHQKQKAQCECGCIIGKYKIKRHRLSWQHHYFMGTLDAYYQQQNNITDKYESSLFRKRVEIINR